MSDNAQGSGRLPLAGLVVIDFGQIFQGPYATLLLAKGGADVIKIEPPSGEPLRRRARPGTSATLPFAMLNQNKRAVTLNLKHPRGRELLFEMVRRADVLLENFSPGTMDDLGVGWSVLREINPRLIYATGTGFGISGPGPRQSRDGPDDPGRLRHHERDRRAGRAADEGRADPGRFHGRHPPLRRDHDRAL